MDYLENEWLVFGSCMMALLVSTLVVRYLTQPEQPPTLPRLRRNFNLSELREYDGSRQDGRILVALNGIIFDVTTDRTTFLPGGPFVAFAGRDCSRNLATYNLSPIRRTTYDDLSDISRMERESIEVWTMEFREKYDVVGRLVPTEDELRRAKRATVRRQQLEIMLQERAALGYSHFSSNLNLNEFRSEMNSQTDCNEAKETNQNAQESSGSDPSEEIFVEVKAALLLKNCGKHLSNMKKKSNRNRSINIGSIKDEYC